MNGKPLKTVTGAKATVYISGKPIAMTTSDITYNIGPNQKVATVVGPYWIFNGEFDDKWSNKYGIRADTMARRNADRGENMSYGRIYSLCNLLWKLRIMKL